MSFTANNTANNTRSSSASSSSDLTSSSPSSSTSSLSSKTSMSSTNGSKSGSSYGYAGSNLVIRCGHIIPQIRLTPPDNRPVKSPEVPEQDLGPNSLYVPLRTEEVGWEEGGLIWAPKRYYYPTVNLYGGEDDHVIGTYRGGPKGYKYINITDSDFALANKEGEGDEEDVSGSSTTSSSSKSKSKLPRKPVKMTTNTSNKSESTALEIVEEKKESEEMRGRDDTMKDLVNYDDSASCSGSSSISSSRHGSISTDDGQSSGCGTGATTPEISESPIAIDGKAVFADQLDNALSTALKEQQRQGEDVEMAESQKSGRLLKQTSKLASRTGSTKSIPNEPIDASKLAGPLKAQLESNPLGHNRSLTLAETKPEKHFQTQSGRSISKLSILDSVQNSLPSSASNQYINGQDASNQLAAGWAYEQNMLSESSDRSLLSS